MGWKRYSGVGQCFIISKNALEVTINKYLKKPKETT